MNLRTQRLMREAFRQLGLRGDGHHESPIVLVADKASQSIIQDVKALPVDPTATDLVNSSGQFYFLVGWSLVGGPDILG